MQSVRSPMMCIVCGCGFQVNITTPAFKLMIIQPKNLDMNAADSWHDRFDISVDIMHTPAGSLGGVLGSTWLPSGHHQVKMPAYCSLSA